MNVKSDLALQVKGSLIKVLCVQSAQILVLLTPSKCPGHTVLLILRVNAIKCFSYFIFVSQE